MTENNHVDLVDELQEVTETAVPDNDPESKIMAMAAALLAPEDGCAREKRYG
jgi:hypothetical protein